MEIVNIVVSGSFNQKVDLQELGALGEVYSYNPEKYHGGYIQLRTARVTVYHSGKYIIYGFRSVDQINQIWNELISLLSKYIDITSFEYPEIKNMVAKEDIGMEIPLNKIQDVLAEKGSEYEPEVFPGLMWTTEYGAVNIFQSGKYILLGCKSIDALTQLNNYIQTQLKEILLARK